LQLISQRLIQNIASLEEKFAKISSV